MPEDGAQQLCPWASQKEFWQRWRQQQVPIPTSPLVPRDEGDRQDLCLCLAEVHKGLPGLGTWQRKPWDDGGSCVGLSLQAGVTPKLQPRKSLRSFPRTHPKS